MFNFPLRKTKNFRGYEKNEENNKIWIVYVVFDTMEWISRDNYSHY